MSHYYSEKQESRLNLNKIKVRLKEFEYELFSGSGVFSKDKLDKGSRLLIENAIIGDNDTVLDFGCGIGVVGISIKKKYLNTEVTFADINKRAIMLTKKNIKLHNLENVIVVRSEIYSKIENKFNTILLNPPQTAGRELCFKMIDESKEHLNDKGILQIVARHNKGGSEFSKKMFKVFGNVKEIAKGSGYRVYVSKYLN